MDPNACGNFSSDKGIISNQYMALTYVEKNVAQCIPNIPRPKWIPSGLKI